MPKPVLVNGSRWARVTCEGIIRHEVSWSEEGIDNTQEFDFYKLLCDCGKRFEVRIGTWKGKRATPDCGCGIAYQVEAKETITIAVPVSMAIKAKVAARDIGFSQWIRDCIQAGLEGRIRK